MSVVELVCNNQLAHMLSVCNHLFHQASMISLNLDTIISKVLLKLTARRGAIFYTSPPSFKAEKSLRRSESIG